jgi:hypothetical protein
MGCVYTLGHQPGSKILNNYCSDVQSYNYGGWAFCAVASMSHTLIERPSARCLTPSGFICRGAAFRTKQRLLFGWQIPTRAAEMNSFKTTLAHGLNVQATIRSVSSRQDSFEIVFRRLAFFC